MTVSVNWRNPYENRNGKWLKGNLHTHTSPASQCGTIPVEKTLDMYASAGYDFLSVSDHMTLTQASHSNLVLIPGIEWNSPGGRHTGIYACDGSVIEPHTKTVSQEELLRSLAGQGALSIINHPNLGLHHHYSNEQLEALPEFDGLEIFNGVIQRLTGSDLSTDRWDYFLSTGRQVFGFASDDFHIASDFGKGWNVVRSESATPEAILVALKAGNFYASSGVELADIWREGDVITVESVNGEEIRVTGDGGRVLRTIEDSKASVDMNDWDCRYVRFTIYGRGSRMAWTQPFFRA